jgi:prevent-host-death family protein
MKEISAVEAKVKFGALLDEIERGEEVIVTRNGKPVAKISPMERRAADVADVVARLKAFREGKSLGGLDWKEMRDEGRK